MKDRVQGLRYNESSHSFKINELEVSITSKCHLRCDNCGFYIPHQPNPSLDSNVVAELVSGLTHLHRMNIEVESLAVLGGDPTYNREILDIALIEFSKFGNIKQIEIVTHGLSPQNISKTVLNIIDKLTISVYFENDDLVSLWENYLNKYAPNVVLTWRTDKEWDKWTGEELVDDTMAQKMFDYCWYRKHCVTLERQRLFACSRIAKLSQDHEGLILNNETSIEDTLNYLNQSSFLNSCRTCTPMMGLPTTKAGIQPDNRVLKMIPNAINFLKTELNEAS